MLRFTLIAEFNTPVAIICDDPPNPGQRNILYGLLPEHAFDRPDLAQRWNVPAVLCTLPFWSAQIKRRPMLRPDGAKLAFLS